MCISNKKKMAFFIFSGFDVLRPIRGLTVGKTAHFRHLVQQPNYPSNIFFLVLFMFADHDNIGKKSKYMILLCTVQKLWLFSLCPNMVIRPYSGILRIAVTFEPYTVQQYFLCFTYVFMVCEHN